MLYMYLKIEKYLKEESSLIPYYLLILCVCHHKSISTELYEAHTYNFIIEIPSHD